MGRRSALLVGTYDYSDTRLQRLAAPGRDVEALAEVLADPEIAGFDVTTLINKPHHVVGEAIGDFYDGLRTDDLALLYITGHGVKDDHRASAKSVVRCVARISAGQQQCDRVLGVSGVMP